MRIAVAAALVAASTLGGGCPESLDWSAAREFAPGMRSLHLTLDEPRLMENYMVRVDLRTPGLRVTGTGRAANWGEVMADVTNRVMLIDTVRRTTRSFLDDHRAHGTNMVLAVNTSPWGPWEPPFTHRHARLPHLAVLNGEVVSHATKRGPMLVIFTNNVAVVTNALDDADLPSVAVAYPGFSIIMRGGETTAKRGRGPKLAPRTAFGLSADGRYLYILVVDGRQMGYSLGADMFDLAELLKAAGAADAINMDGGGSSTLVRWDGEKGEAVTDNRHDPGRRFYRNVAASIGFYFANAACAGPRNTPKSEATTEF